MLKYFMDVDNSQTAVDDSHTVRDDSHTAVDDSHTAVATANAAIIAFYSYWLLLTLLAATPYTKDNSLCF